MYVCMYDKESRNPGCGESHALYTADINGTYTLPSTFNDLSDPYTGLSCVSTTVTLRKRLNGGHHCVIDL